MDRELSRHASTRVLIICRHPKSRGRQTGKPRTHDKNNNRKQQQQSIGEKIVLLGSLHKYHLSLTAAASVVKSLYLTFTSITLKKVFSHHVNGLRYVIAARSIHLLALGIFRRSFISSRLVAWPCYLLLNNSLLFCTSSSSSTYR